MDCLVYFKAQTEARVANPEREFEFLKKKSTCPKTMTSNLIPKALYSVRSSTPFSVLYFAYLQN